MTVYAPEVQARMCHSKRPYLCELDARTVAAKREGRGSGPLRAYQCPNCKFWHLTSAARR